MNISKVHQTQETSFDYLYTDTDGIQHTEKIEITVKRLSFKDSVSKEFQEAFKELEKDPEKITDILPKLLDDWNITDTIGGKEVPWPITKESLLDPRVDISFIAGLSEAVMGVIAPNPQKDATSATT